MYEKLNRRELLGAGAGLGLVALQGKSVAAAGLGAVGSVRTVALEEACIPADLLAEWERVRGAPYAAPLRGLLTDIHGKRLEDMDRYGIEMQVISMTVPGPQGDPNPVSAQEMAHRGNDAIAREVAKRPTRFAGFGTLAMHDVDIACRELERAVKELGLCGVLLNNYQRAGIGGEKVLFYDQPEYDTFWDTAQKLDAPIYLHPNVIPNVGGRTRDFAAFPWLKDAAWLFAATTGFHALRIITSGVFDRFPKAKFILGHMGEHIVYDIWRIGNRLKRQPEGCPAKREIHHYFRNNVYVTTSGEFTDHGLEHAIREIGADRILFSIDHPYEDVAEAMSWFGSTPIGDAERHAIGRHNVIQLLKLPLKG